MHARKVVVAFVFPLALNIPEATVRGKPNVSACTKMDSAQGVNGFKTVLTVTVPYLKTHLLISFQTAAVKRYFIPADLDLSVA